MKKYDFSGWATKAGLRCSDGRTILKDAFKENDGTTVPLVWNHQHNDPYNVLGNALLENRDQGVYAYCSFNDTEAGRNAKLVVEHGDVVALSIFANQLRQREGNVYHGAIREVSLVLAGANPGAFIDSVISHGSDSEEEGTIYTGEPISLEHSEATKKEEAPVMDDKDTRKKDEGEETVGDVFNTLSEKQKNVVYAMIGSALEEKAGADDKEEEDDNVKHNIFDRDDEHSENVLSHSEMAAIINDGKRYGTLKESALQHGIENLDVLFPDAKAVTNTPDFIARDTDWVSDVMNGVHHTPFSRIKSVHADITEDEARAKGYIKGKLKKEEVFSLLKRTTEPTTVYKKQKLDRDDVIDITDFDVVAWLKGEMRGMLNEELARAYLIGDGRPKSSDDKIPEDHIRPIWTDDDLYTIKAEVDGSVAATADQRAKTFIRTVIKSRKDYKGSGNPVLFTTEDLMTECLLLEDNNGRAIYDTEEKLRTALRVKKIVTVPVMENQTRTDKDGSTFALMGIIVNLSDYKVGADKGGAVSLFDDFDIDYNAQKYLIETRCSGALTKPFSAIAVELKTPAVTTQTPAVTTQSKAV